MRGGPLAGIVAAAACALCPSALLAAGTDGERQWLDGLYESDSGGLDDERATWVLASSGSGSGSWLPEPEPEPEPEPHRSRVLWAAGAAALCVVLVIGAWQCRRRCCAVQQREAALRTEFDDGPMIQAQSAASHRHQPAPSFGSSAVGLDAEARDPPPSVRSVNTSARYDGRTSANVPGLRSSLDRPLVAKTEKRPLDDVADVGW